MKKIKSSPKQFHRGGKKSKLRGKNTTVKSWLEEKPQLYKSR